MAQNSSAAAFGLLRRQTAPLRAGSEGGKRSSKNLSPFFRDSHAVPSPFPAPSGPDAPKAGPKAHPATPRRAGAIVKIKGKGWFGNNLRRVIFFAFFWGIGYTF